MKKLMLLLLAAGISTQLAAQEKTDPRKIHYPSFEEAFKAKPDEVYTIYINDKQLTEIPKKVLKLKNLERLSLRDCSVKQIPKWLKELPNLKTLDLSNNGLTEIPAGIFELAELEELILYDNYFTGIPDEITRLTKLQKLHL